MSSAGQSGGTASISGRIPATVYLPTSAGSSRDGGSGEIDCTLWWALMVGFNGGFNGKWWCKMRWASWWYKIWWWNGGFMWLKMAWSHADRKLSRMPSYSQFKCGMFTWETPGLWESMGLEEPCRWQTATNKFARLGPHRINPSYPWCYSRCTQFCFTAYARHILSTDLHQLLVHNALTHTHTHFSLLTFPELRLRL